MRLSNTITVLAAALLATPAIAELSPFEWVECEASASALRTAAPTPTDKTLASWLATNTAKTNTVPPTLRPALCTFEAAVASWAKSDALPFASRCSDFLGSASASSYISNAESLVTTRSYCVKATGKKGGGAAPRQTKSIAPGLSYVAGGRADEL